MIPKIKIQDTFFYKFKITICSTCFIVLLGHFKIGFTIALGSFFTYPSDIRNLKHKVNGILVTVLIVSGVNLINVIYPYLGFSILFFIVIFPFNDFSLRTKATMVSFSALASRWLCSLAGWDRIQYSGLILLEVYSTSLFL
jgi:hypothetical protein